MHPAGTAGFRASIVARARFIEDLVAEQAAAGVRQYVILGAGLDTLAQRRPDLAGSLRIFEVDQPGTQAWKRRRLVEAGSASPTAAAGADRLRDAAKLVGWVAAAGFDAGPSPVVRPPASACTSPRTPRPPRCVSSPPWPPARLAMTFLLPPELVDDAERQMQVDVEHKARNSGTPFVSYYSPDEMVEMCFGAGFSSVKHVSPAELTELYFSGRTDGLRPPTAEQLVVAQVGAPLAADTLGNAPREFSGPPT